MEKVREQNAPSVRRFIDANVFLYAFISTKRKLSEKDSKLKQASKAIVERIEKGEKVMTSAVHLSEISNVLEDVMPKSAIEIVESIVLNENIEIVSVGKEEYAASLEMAKIHGAGINDCVAAVIMSEKNIKEIYSFDTDFDKITGITRIEK